MPPQPGLPAHDHDCGEGDCGLLYSLYKDIDLPQVHIKVPLLCLIFSLFSLFGSLKSLFCSNRSRVLDLDREFKCARGILPCSAGTPCSVLQVTCLNEQSEGSCRSVFKPWDQRTCFSSAPLKSCLDDDAELLLHIPCVLNLCPNRTT